MEQNILANEQQYLQDTVAVVQKLLDKAARESEEYAQAIRAIQEDWSDTNAMETGGMFKADDFFELLEVSQNTEGLAHMTSARQEAEAKMRALVRTMDSPYFARIDFRGEDGGTRQVYIGKATLMEDDPLRIHVYDWRVPIASVFYRYGTGPAEYEAPGGAIRGEVTLKRQYEIRHGALVYYFDADAQVMDSFLRELLSKPAAPAMKSIVETIQRDQDRIIRDMTADLLMVQGTAGSGKTSVALHRIAYLMYQGLQGKQLAPHDIMILAPNTAFERYIAQVLPDLGEKQVQTQVFEELIEELLPGVAIEPRGEWVEAWLLQADTTRRERMRASRAMKGSAAFVTLLERFIGELPDHWLPLADVDYAGERVADAEEMRATLHSPDKMAPLGIRLRMLEKGIWRRVHALRPAHYAQLLTLALQPDQETTEPETYARMLSIQESGQLLRQLRAFTEIDCAALYRMLFANRDAFARLSDGLLPSDEAETMRADTLARLVEGGPLPYEDALAVAYLQARVYGCRTYTSLRQVVVDEAQDLDTLHASLLALLFPNARFTVLGDVNQTLVGSANLSLYDDLQATIRRPHSLLVTLDKSFRCTREIWAFGAHFLPPGTAGECFSRNGETPGLHHAADDMAMDALLAEHVRDCHEKGCQSVALLCKTQRDARQLFERLHKKLDGLYLMESGKGIRPGGTAIVPLYLAKGLEFDAVLLCDVDAAHYRDEMDKGLLYIGCTRALHVLRLFYVGQKSPLLPAEMEETP